MFWDQCQYPCPDILFDFFVVDALGLAFSLNTGLPIQREKKYEKDYTNVLI